jgi:hypothetical protein
MVSHFIWNLHDPIVPAIVGTAITQGVKELNQVFGVAIIKLFRERLRCSVVILLILLVTIVKDSFAIAFTWIEGK